jgi:RNA polymerase sigma-70 factor (sigma-E family)
MADDQEGTGDDYTAYVTAKVHWLRKIAYLLCQDWHRADDLTQTTIIKLYANWRRARGCANLDGYTRTILVNTFISEQRTPWWTRVTLVNPTAPESVPTTDEALGAALERDLELGLDLAGALAALAPRQRAVIVLRYYCDLSIEDTATALRCAPGTVKSQASHGLAALRSRLTPGAGPEPGPEHARTSRPGPDPSHATV